MGFCFFNTIACVAEWIREQPASSASSSLNFDVHHGNGTQALFWTETTCFYASMHRFRFTPTRRDERDRRAAGRGYTLNIPRTRASAMPPTCAEWKGDRARHR